jgi:GR25 family glycosyltransferase involved in LPS biosynthesis
MAYQPMLQNDEQLIQRLHDISHAAREANNYGPGEWGAR